MRSLLDVNALVALTFPDHELHPRTYNWMRRDPNHPWASCALTQSGFLRVASFRMGNTREAVQKAFHALTQSSASPDHVFWPVDIDLLHLPDSFRSRLLGPKQITDVQLLLLAHHHRGQLVTHDKGLVELARGTRYADSLLIL